MSYRMDTIEYKGYRIRIENDDDCENPHTAFDNLAKWALFHRRYSLPNDYELNVDDFNGLDELRQHITETYDPLLLCTVYMYEHGGTAYSLSRDFGDIDPGHWDSGIVGLMWIEREDALKEYKPEDFPNEHYQSIEDWAFKLMEGELEEYETWANGYCCGWIAEAPFINEEDADEYEADIDDDNDWAEIEDGSVWGYYDQKYAVEAAKDHIDWYIGWIAEQDAKEKQDADEIAWARSMAEQAVVA